MGIIIYLFIILAVGLVIFGLISSRQGRAIDMPQPQASFLTKPSKFNILLARALPTRSFLQKLGIYDKIKKATEASHINLMPEGFFNLRIFITLGLAAVVAATIGRDLKYIAAALVIGYIAPGIYLRQRIAKRKYQIARRLPETVDLLGLCIEAGLDFVNAVRWVIDKTPVTPMTEELALVLEEIKWGKPRIQALKDMSRRLDISEVSSFTQTIIQAERMGTPVADAFTILSEDARAQRFHRGERIALQAPIKILLPLIFFIMPVIGIVIGGPILLQFMQGGLSGLK